ncbi:MAG TPA: hypothetical protein VIF09_11645 [Polyangiaceae bacterium]|jgi:hypothetical protein
MSGRISLHLSSWLAVALALAACGGSPSANNLGDDAGAGDDSGSSADGAASGDTGSAPRDAGGDTGGGDASGPPDGPPSYTSACTPLSQQTGTALNTFHGRLDGYLAFIVPQGGSSSCNGDNSHVHLQVRMKGSIYDVAVDIGKFAGDALFYEADMAMPPGVWSEGWHDVGLSYPNLGVHSGAFTTSDPATLGKKIESELANVNHISVFGDSYNTANGCHDVHYQNGSTDGAIVIDPLSTKPHVLFFRFSTASF